MKSFWSCLGSKARIGLLACAAAPLGIASAAHASGPTERIQQVLPHPSDPNLITVRWGMASSGYLYSKDGGKTFRAFCSSAVNPEASASERVKKISLRSVAGNAANAIDSEGRVAFSQYGALYTTDDSTGCSWNRVADFDDRWAFGMAADPAAEGVVWAAVTSSSTDTLPVTKMEIARRDAAGKWTTVASIVRPITGEVLLDGNMLIAHKDGKKRLYVTADLGGANGYTQHVYVSDDEGKTWADYRLPAKQETLELMAVDPQNSDRLVGAVWHDGEADELFLSEDRGRTWSVYPGSPGIRAVSGATFDARGRFLIGDQGDGVNDENKGGLYVADKLGGPLRRAEGTQFVDCIHYRALTDTLYMCSYDKLSTLDPDTFEARELVRIDTVAGLLECPGRDLTVECKEQLNEGPSWCCAGHFPFTPFCGEYDVSVRADGRRVFCGLAGREYDRPGSTTEMPASSDAGTPRADDVLGDAPGDDAPTSPTSPSSGNPKSSSGGGCALGDATRADDAAALLSGLTVALALLARRRSRAQTTR